MKDSEPQHDLSQGRYYGPCLYLGADGQRCDRRAREDGFCDRHAPEGAGVQWGSPVRLAAAILVLITTIWPLLAHLWRELAAWLR